MSEKSIKFGLIITGSHFSEPMRVETYNVESNWHDSSHTQRAESCRRPPRLLLALCSHGLYNKAYTPGAYKGPGPFPWREVKKIDHYWLDVNAMIKPMKVCDGKTPYKKDN
jgi:hypothetical protein